MVNISVRADIKAISKQLDRLAYQQIPYASALAVTGIARRLQQQETRAMQSVFDRPTPFTMKAFGVIPATKATLTAVVFAKDIQAKYLAPSEFSEPQYLGRGKKIRTPVDVATNASGNLAKGKIKQLLARADVFMGTVKGVNGIWQRPAKPGAGGKRVARSGAQPRSNGLVLLVAFTRPKEVKTHLEFRARAQNTVSAYFKQEFSVAMERALATAKA